MLQQHDFTDFSGWIDPKRWMKLLLHPPTSLLGCCSLYPDKLVGKSKCERRVRFVHPSLGDQVSGQANIARPNCCLDQCLG